MLVAQIYLGKEEARAQMIVDNVYPNYFEP